VFFGPVTNTGTQQLDPESATVLASSQPSDSTKTIAFISYSGGGTLVTDDPITDVSWTNDTGESVDVVIRSSGRYALVSVDAVIGRKITMRWSLNGGGSWSYDGTSADNPNISSTTFQDRVSQRTVTVADGETLDAEIDLLLIIPDPTAADPADVYYRGLSLSIEAILR
jgi:hypothetical protein